MAEFCEVIFKYKKMCKGADCDKCPLSQTRNGYGLKCDELLTDIPVAFERIVMTQRAPELPKWREGVTK